jgi:hypothetical protein
VTADCVKELGAVVVWAAIDTIGAPPADIRARFPELVPEVPRAFERPFQGILPLVRIGWAVARPQSAAAPLQPLSPPPAASEPQSAAVPITAPAPAVAPPPQVSQKAPERPPVAVSPPVIPPAAAAPPSRPLTPLEPVPLPRRRPIP